jgi:cell division protein FtsL
MSRLNVLLLMAVMASAFYLVRTQYDSRRLYTEFDRARSEARNLELERERLEVERRSQGTALRVEKVAKEELHMRSVTPAITQYVYRPLDESTPAPKESQPSQNATSKTNSTDVHTAQWAKKSSEPLPGDKGVTP